MDKRIFASHIDHTLLHPNAKKEEFSKLVSEALVYGFRAVVVPGYRVKTVREMLPEGSDVKLAQVIGYPLGNESWKQKVAGIQSEADELDLVMNIGAFLDGDFDYVKSEINAVKSVAPEKFLKVIISTPYLTDKQIADATKLVSESKANCIKTCTGWEERGVSLHDLFIIQHYKRDSLMVKASGKIQDVEFAIELIHAGANIIGSRSSMKLLEQFVEDTKIGGELA